MRFTLPTKQFGATMLAACLSTGVASPSLAQDIEPRAYANAPTGMNFLVLGYAYTRGGLSFDPSLDLTDAKLKSSNAVLAFARSLDVWGHSGTIGVVVPYSHLSGTAVYGDEPVQRTISGFANPAFRLAVNLYGSPALSLREFAGWKQDLIVGASLRVTAPWSQYDPGKLVNIGTNRWTYKPEVAVSKAVGAWTLEMAAATTFFTDNNDFFGGNMRTQQPLYSVQGHVIRNFSPGIWAAIDATYFTGGRTTFNGTTKYDLQQTWRIGATAVLPIDRHNSIKVYGSSGVSARTGNNYDLIGAAWQYRWGAGF